MGTRWVLVKPIVAKYPLSRWYPNMIQELLDIFDFPPCLSLYHHLIFDSDQLHLLVVPLLPVEVFDVVTVNLNWWYLQVILLAALLVQSPDLTEYKLGCPREDTTDLIDSGIAICLEGRGVGRALHSVSLARTGLAIGENTHIFTVNGWLDERLHFVENLGLGRERGEDTVKVIQFGERQLLEF